MSDDPRTHDERVRDDVDDWEPRPCPDDFGREPTSKPPDPRIRKPKTRRGPGV